VTDRTPKATLAIGDGTIYADTVEDLAIVLDYVRAEQAGAIAALEENVEQKGHRIISLEAELKDWKETHVYGPQLHQERDAALLSRDRALQQLETTEASRRDLDATRRALAAEVRTLKAQLEAETDRANINQQALEMRAAMDKRNAKKRKGARRR
jgi:hypothetical protein